MWHGWRFFVGCYATERAKGVFSGGVTKVLLGPDQMQVFDDQTRGRYYLVLAPNVLRFAQDTGKAM